MSKKRSVAPVDFEKAIMAKVKSNEISMKPRWYFVLGSLFMVAGIVGISIGAVFLTNITLFLLRQHGPMGEWRLQSMIQSFPLWVPLLAVVGIFFGIVLLRKYDFSYKKNFLMVIIGFILSIVLTAFLMDFMGLNDIWARQGPMRRFYQSIDGKNITLPNGQGQGWMRKR